MPTLYVATEYLGCLESKKLAPWTLVRWLCDGKSQLLERVTMQLTVQA
ncbi:hypothetical protein SP21_96 [Salmonella phage 21]|nr:hypothetical protein SP21_96 [Salmonella phage 21]